MTLSLLEWRHFYSVEWFPDAPAFPLVSKSNPRTWYSAAPWIPGSLIELPNLQCNGNLFMVSALQSSHTERWIVPAVSVFQILGCDDRWHIYWLTLTCRVCFQLIWENWKQLNCLNYQIWHTWFTARHLKPRSKQTLRHFPSVLI